MSAPPPTFSLSRPYKRPPHPLKQWRAAINAVDKARISWKGDEWERAIQEGGAYDLDRIQLEIDSAERSGRWLLEQAAQAKALLDRKPLRVIETAE